MPRCCASQRAPLRSYSHIARANIRKRAMSMNSQPNTTLFTVRPIQLVCRWSASAERNTTCSGSMCTPAGHTAEQASHTRQFSSCSSRSGVTVNCPSATARARPIRPRGPSASCSESTYVGHDVRHAPQRMQASMLSYSSARRGSVERKAGGCKTDVG